MSNGTLSFVKEFYSLDELKELWYKYHQMFDAQMRILILMQTLFTHRENFPYLMCDDTAGTYTDMKTIHIGLGGIKVRTEMAFVIRVLYLIGHECGHILHTPDKPWKDGINRGTNEICQIISDMVDGAGYRNIRSPRDVESFCSDMEAKGIHISVQAIQHYIHFIQNSLEDGRIERILSCHNVPFKNRMRAERGETWLSAPISPEQVKAVKAGDKNAALIVKLNQVLSLATTGYFQKGFLDEFIDTPIYDDVMKLNEEIYAAVHAGACRKMVPHAIVIEKAFAEEIFEASKINPLQQMLNQLASSPQGQNGQGQGSASYDSHNEDEKRGEGEDTEDGSGNVFSDGEGENSESGNEQSNGDGQDSDGNGDGEDAGEENGNRSGQFGDKGKGNGSEGEDGDSADGSDGSADGKNGKDSKKGGREKAGCVYDHQSNRAGGRNVGASGSQVHDFAAVEQAIEDAMRDAMNQAQGLIGPTVENINNKPAQQKEVSYKFEPVKPLKAVAAEYPGMKFDEKERKYKLLYPLPSDLQTRAEKLKSELEEILEKQKKEIYGLTSGTIDSSALTKFILGDTDIWMRESDPKKPEDYCCYILTDNSGSMGYGRGSKRDYAWEANSIMEYAFKDLMPLKITAFDSQGSNYCVHERVKDFDEKQPGSCSYNFLIQGRGGCGNTDGFDIRIATQELLARREQHKMLIILSDGTPSGYNSWNAGISEVKSAVEDAISAGLDVFSIYFSDNMNNNSELSNYREMYGDNFVATTPDNIEIELKKLIKKFYLG